MNCPQSESTLLWLYGDVPDAPTDHLAQCAECQQLVAEHEAVVSALGPALGALSEPGGVAPVAANLRWRAVRAVATVAVGIAAVGLWTMRAPSPDPPEGARVAVEAGPAAVVDTAVAQVGVRIDDGVDLRLDDLEWEVDALTLDLETL